MLRMLRTLRRFMHVTQSLRNVYAGITQALRSHYAVITQSAILQRYAEITQFLRNLRNRYAVLRSPTQITHHYADGNLLMVWQEMRRVQLFNQRKFS